MNENRSQVIRTVASQGRCTGPKDVTFGRSEQGTEQMGLVYEVTKGEFEGRRLPWYGTVDSDKALALVKETLMTSGWDGGSLGVLEGLGLPVVTLVIEVIEIEGRDGFPRELPKLRFVNRLAQATMKNPIEGDERKRLTSQLEARMRDLKPNGARPSRASSVAGGFPEEERSFDE